MEVIIKFKADKPTKLNEKIAINIENVTTQRAKFANSYS